jgi:Raf kinase inhibitor-like YbhB/YbcL family protein
VPANMTVTSQAFSPSSPIPARYTCHGAGLSPSIHWTGAPPATKSLAVIVDDSAAPITPYIYWIVFDIGPQTSGTLIGHVPTGARVADNSKGTARYDAPCPVNSSHMYRFTVYALNRTLSLSNGANMKTAWMAIAQATIARGRLTATANP